MLSIISLLIVSQILSSCFIYINTDGSEDIHPGDTSVYSPFKIQDYIRRNNFKSVDDIPSQTINANNVRQIVSLNTLTWVMLWTPHCQQCREKMPELFATYHNHEKDGLSLVLISEDYELKFTKKTLLKYHYDKPEYVLSAADYSRKIVKKTQRFHDDLSPELSGKPFEGYPMNFIYDKNMKLLFYGCGDVKEITLDSICNLYHH